MVGQLASCNALEPLIEAGDQTIRPRAELIQESVTLRTGADLAPQETMSESPAIQVT